MYVTNKVCLDTTGESAFVAVVLVGERSLSVAHGSPPPSERWLVLLVWVSGLQGHQMMRGYEAATVDGHTPRGSSESTLAAS